MDTDAIVLEGVTKHFKKRSVRREYTTLKTEMVRWLKRERRLLEPITHIEALTGVDLRIPRGSTVGIIGRNGSGKSTLLKLITGIYTATGGKLEVNGRISALLELGAGFHPDFTGRENILINGIILGMSRAEVKARTPEIIEFSELGDFIDEPVRTYSSGMFMRLAFAVATHVDPEILIIDEILSVGDEHFGRKSMAKMNEFKRSGRTIVLVTHGLSTVENWCDLAVWIDGGKARLVGHPARVVAEYRRAINAAEAESERTGHSALSAPGLALPQLESAARADAVARLTAVRLRDGLGAQPSAFGAEDRLEVALDYEATRAAPLEFSVDVLTADGRLVFSTAFNAGDVQPGSGSGRLTLPRLGLGPGTYDLNAAVHVAGAPAEGFVRVTLTVAPHPGGQGVLRPEHAWSLERSEASSDPESGPARPSAQA